MKIIHALSWYFPQHLGGTEVYVEGLAKRQQLGGHEVAVVAPLAGLAGQKEYDFNGIRVFRFGTPLTPSKAESQGRISVRGADAFARFIDQHRPDWVHFHSFSTGLSVPELEAARSSGARTVATNHLGSLGFICQRGTLMRWGEQLCDGICKPIKCAECELQHRGLNKPAARLLARAGEIWPLAKLPGAIGTAFGMAGLIRHNMRLQERIMEAVEAFVVLNQWARDAVIANGAPREKIFLNRLGVDTSNLETKPEPQLQPTRFPVKVGYFGRITELKGVGELAAAFARLPRDLPITLEFRGPARGEADQLLLAHVKELIGHDKRVLFGEAVSPAEAAKILTRYDVLCVPSKWFENGPTVMLEALAVGTPVIGTTIGAVPEVISHGKNGWLVEPGDTKALAQALRMVASDPLRTIDEWRRHLPPTRTMDDVARDYLRLYESR
jgi:glycosyltransferase involved in cell wall biosynthesis